MKSLFYKSDNRHATWLELFFDLIFVVVLGKITHFLTHIDHGHLAPESWVKFILLFIPAWWIWFGHTNFANRFDNDNRPYRFVTLLLMFLLILLSISITYEIEEDPKFFIIVYSISRLFISGFYYSVGFRFPHKKKYSRTIGSVYAIGALISFTSIFFSFSLAALIFFMGIAFDLLVPILFKIHTKNYPIDKEHLVERIGLLGIILLGESIIALSGSIGNVNWDLNTISLAVTGFVILCMVWWIYYDSFYYLRNSELDAHGYAISYSQLLTYMAFAILANMIRHAILSDLNLMDFRFMVIFGMTLFFIGKQTSYWFNVPEHRRFNTINALISTAIVSLSLMFQKEIYIMLGVSLSMMAYIFLTYRSQVRLHGRAQM